MVVSQGFRFSNGCSAHPSEMLGSSMSDNSERNKNLPLHFASPFGFLYLSASNLLLPFPLVNLNFNSECLGGDTRKI